MLLALIQARSGSTRLKDKALLPLKDGETSLVQAVYNTAIQIPAIDLTLCAVPKKDAKVKKHLESKDIPYVQGDENDVLNRFYKAAASYKASGVVRLTSDCPFMPVPILYYMADQWKRMQQKPMLMTNTLHYPDGWDVEIFPAAILEFLNDKLDKDSKDREHVVKWLYDNQDDEELKKFCEERGIFPHVVLTTSPVSMTGLKLSIDTQEEYDTWMKD